MAQYPFKLIYGNSFGLEEKATELISQALSEYLDYPFRCRARGRTIQKHCRVGT